ncbi:MAG: substrate-binding domain-containing protein, partial [Nocardioides sp.]
DALNIDAESPTALNPVIKQACDAGIKVIVFDQTTDSTDDCATFLYNPLKDYGAALAESVATQLDGAGNLILVEGVVGGKPNAEIKSGVEEVLKNYPDIKLVSTVVGESSDSVTEKALSGVLPTLEDVDGVISWGGTSGILSAFAKAKRPLPALVFDNSGESLRKLSELYDQDPSFTGSGVFTDPGQGAAAFQATMLMKDGTDLPKEIITPVINVPKEDLESWIAVTGPGAVAQWLWTEDDVSKVIETQGSDDLFTPAIPSESL